MFIGIDLGGTKIEIIVLNPHSQELYRHRIPSPQGNYAQTVDTLCKLIQDTEQHLGQCNGIGIGIPGALSPETGKIKNANSTWLIGHDLRTDLSQKLNRTVFIANDADCFTLSEATDGAAANYTSVFGVILGTGVGGGISIRGTLLSGPNAIAGEWGHNSLPWQTEHDKNLPCYCGKSGCIETYLSGPGMLKHFQKQHPEIQVSTSHDIVALAHQSHKEATDYLDTYLNRLGRSLASVINILDPDAIVLGGGLSNVDAIYQGINKHLLSFVFSESVRTPILKAKHGDSSGVRGAAWLGAQDLDAIQQVNT